MRIEHTTYPVIGGQLIFEPFFAAVTFLVFLPFSSVSNFACALYSPSPARRKETFGRFPN